MHQKARSPANLHKLPRKPYSELLQMLNTSSLFGQEKFLQEPAIPKHLFPHQLPPQAYLSLPNTAKTASKILSPIIASLPPDTRNRPHSYVNALTKQTSSQEHPSINTNLNSLIENVLDEVKHSDLDTFLRILELIQKHYTKCTSNIERVRESTILICQGIGSWLLIIHLTSCYGMLQASKTRNTKGFSTNNK